MPFSGDSAAACGDSKAAIPQTSSVVRTICPPHWRMTTRFGRRDEWMRSYTQAMGLVAPGKDDEGNLAGTNLSLQLIDLRRRNQVYSPSKSCHARAFCPPEAGLVGR